MVEFKSVFSADKVNVANERSIKKTRSLFFVIMGVCGVLGLLLVCVALEENQKNHDMSLYNMCAGIALIVVGVFYYPFLKWFSRKFQNKINNTMSLISSQTEEYYRFDEEKIYIKTTKGNEYKSVVEAKYNYINNIVETNDYYFLYISKVQCHILGKADLVSGSLEELNAIFEKHFTPECFKREIK